MAGQNNGRGPGRPRMKARSRDRLIEVVQSEQTRLNEQREKLEGEIAERQERLAEVKEDLALMDATDKVVKPKSRGRKRTRQTDPGKAVGQANVDMVREEMRGRGRAAQSEVRKAVGKNSGTVSLAFKALEAEGFVRDTGEKQDRSTVWEVVRQPAIA